MVKNFNCPKLVLILFQSFVFFSKISVFCTILCYFLRYYVYCQWYSLISSIISPIFWLIEPLIFPVFTYWLSYVIAFYASSYLLLNIDTNNMFVTRKQSFGRNKMSTNPKSPTTMSPFTLLLSELKGIKTSFLFYVIMQYPMFGDMKHGIIQNADLLFDDDGCIGSLLAWFLFMIVWSDISFYISHYVLHLPWFYKRIHKRHHEYNIPVAFSSGYRSELEGIIVFFLDAFPFMIANIIGFKAHIIHLLSWNVIGTIYNAEGHSGYSLFFVTSMNSFHDYHHTVNRGNYGISSIWDYVFNTCSERWLNKENTKFKL